MLCRAVSSKNLPVRVTMEELSLVPGARIRLTSEADIRYEGTIVSVDDKQEKLTLSQVLSFGIAQKQTRSSAAAKHIVYGYVVFRRSELKKIKILDTPKPWPTDPAVVKAVENCVESRAVEFSKQVLTWIEKGDAQDNERLNIILENSHLHRSFDATEKTLLHHAVQYSNVSVVQSLLALGSDVNAQDSMGMTPLMVAMAEYKKHAKVGLKIIKIVLAAGADILLLNKSGRSAVHMFCDDYNVFYDIRKNFFQKLRQKCPLSEDSVASLMDAGLTLHQAYEFLVDLEIIEMMLQRGFPVDDLDEVSIESVLHSAIDLRDIECVELLLKHGASVKLENDAGDTPWACLISDCNCEIVPEEELKIVQLLLAHGASPTTRISGGIFQGQTTLQGAERDTIRLILKYDLDFSATDELNQSALHFLASNENPGVAEELKSFKKAIVNVNARDEKGATPLYWAVQYGNTEMLNLLLSMGAEVDCRTDDSFTALYYLCTRSSYDSKRNGLCAEILLQHHADPQIVVAETNGERITVFEAASTACKLSSTKPFVAQMAISERLGTAIAENVRATIRSKPALEEHLKVCRRLLRRKIAGTTTLLTLLTADKRTMAKLLHNEDLVLKLTDSFLSELRLSSPYYHNTITKRYADGVQYQTLREKSAVSVAKIFGGDVDEGSLIVGRILDFLDDTSLGCLKDLF